MAKPAVIELNRSIILAGGAPTLSSLRAALTSIQEALKNSDWATRKAGCMALGDIASCGVVCLDSFRTSSIRCLESCRYDKVKPVRDIALQALKLWRNLPGPNIPEPSEAGSSVQDTPYSDEYGDITSASDSTLKDIPLMKSGPELAKRRVPLSSGKVGRAYIDKSQTNDWHIEIATPKNCNISAGKNQNDESEGCLATNSSKRSNADVWSINDVGYDYVQMEDKLESSSVSNFFSESIKSKVVKTHSDAFDDASLLKSTASSQRFAADEVSIEEQRCLDKMHDRRSLDSTVTESIPHVMQGSSQTEKEMALIRNQLLEIENKQSDLMDMLKALTTTIVDSVSKVQMKVSNLELIVDKIAQELLHGRRYSDSLTKKGSSIVSPRLSTCTPRPSVDSRRQLPLLPTKHVGIHEDRLFTRSRSSSFRKQNSDMWIDATNKQSKSSVEGAPTSFYPEIHGDQMQKMDMFCNPVPPAKARAGKLETKNSSWKVVRDYLSEGDLDSAYVEALCSRNELLLFDLLDRTGPILGKLSKKTASELLSTLASYLLEQRFLNSIIPWLQQLVDLSNIHGPSYLVLGAKTKRDFLSAILEAAKLDIFDLAERKFFIELGKTLRQIWGIGTC
ncbi:hypothetical protein CDL12_22562 [Handroanthus impetiginosus]|uniref:TOG domain-containing protein n=1 Tax=Handroanthus impetiginosus TaxID=429701 RepID=A0A2G9GHY5_9LAMI|nr:hypothetical protein CDL12_22562 [Handroanthus impetiginosus]